MTTPAIDTREIRAWAEKRHLIEPGTRGRLSAEVHAAYANEHALAAEAAATVTGSQPEQPLHVPVREVPPTSAPEQGKPETPPAIAKERASERARKFWQRDKTDEPAAGRPRRAGKRVSLETLGGLMWAGGARLVAFAGETYIPVVKMMSFQGPVAGAVVEDLAKGTIADKIMQPVARLTESGGAVGALVGAPVLTAVVCRRPDLYPAVKPMLMQCMKEWVIVAGPKLREMRKREEKFAAEMATFTDEFGLTVDDLLDEVFAGFVPQQAPPPTAEANGHAG